MCWAAIKRGELMVRRHPTGRRWTGRPPPCIAGPGDGDPTFGLRRFMAAPDIFDLNDALTSPKSPARGAGLAMHGGFALIPCKVFRTNGFYIFSCVYFFNSVRATCRRCTASGPSAKRSARCQVQDIASVVSWLIP